MHAQVAKDPLTQVANRAEFDRMLNNFVAAHQESNLPCSLIMSDIDQFKSINDTYGHLTGDSVLRGLASILQKRLRPNDKLGRYGGEEFCAILPETNIESAARIAEELRALVAAHTFAADGKELRVTISIGAAELGGATHMDALYKRADDKLYEAKRTGRNRVCY